jgi:hypothetical protein
MEAPRRYLNFPQEKPDLQKKRKLKKIWIWTQIYIIIRL